MGVLLNFGSMNIDHVYRVHEFVRPGETLSSRSYQKLSGGKGLNQSIALARAGAKVIHVGVVGSDGTWLVDMLNTDGVNVSQILVDSAVSTGHAIIQVDDHGQNCIILHAGANHALDLGRCERTLKDHFAPGHWVLFQNETNGVPELITMAKTFGYKVALNPAPMTPAVHSYPLQHVDCLIINEIEGHDFTGEADPKAILRKFTNDYPALAVVLTLGSDGAMFSSADIGPLCQSAKSLGDLVDTTGAGDTFIGYFLASYINGTAAARALDVAATAAALSVTKMGAAASIPTLNEVRRYVQN